MKPPPVAPRSPDHVLETRLERLTPQYGGGAKAGELANEIWLRPPAVRGALRYWWRALHAHEFGTLGELREAESDLFGSVHGLVRRSAVTVQVRDADKIATAATLVDRPDEKMLYPQSWRGDGKAHLHKGGAGPTAALRLVGSPSLDQARWEQVRAALVAWVTFGGAGARTRRGVGAVGFADEEAARATDAPWGQAELDRWLRELPMTTDHDANGAYSLARRVCVWRGPKCVEASQAQASLRELWYAFRQPRQRKVDDPRATWPEGASIQNGSHPVETPRVHLGLPLTIDPEGVGGGKPSHAVQGKPPRLGSPIRLAVTRVGESDHRALVLVVPSPLSAEPDGLTIAGRTARPGPFEDVVKRLRLRIPPSFDRIQSVEGSSQ